MHIVLGAVIAVGISILFRRQIIGFVEWQKSTYIDAYWPDGSPPELISIWLESRMYQAVGFVIVVTLLTIITVGIISICWTALTTPFV
ncbi:MAG: hypothetical protein HZB53_07035 [Chloroflexi bacterium]|nr:hypothetical protein [Chloroflexota bacterium]